MLKTSVLVLKAESKGGATAQESIGVISY